MKAMILAAGRGRRMRHLTKDMPKPLLSVRGKSFLEAQIDRLVKEGIVEIIINVAYLGDQIIKAIGFGARWARGCTSGHGLSGTMQLAVSSWLAVACFFIGGTITAMFFFRVFA